MSHTVVVTTKVRDPAAITAACHRLNLAAPTKGKARLYSSDAEGIIVQLPGWHYPIVANVESGNIAFDDFNGRWGERRFLEQFLQAYAIEVARIDARRHGRTVVEQQLPDGSILLDIQVGG